MHFFACGFKRSRSLGWHIDDDIIISPFNINIIIQKYYNNKFFVLYFTGDCRTYLQKILKNQIVFNIESLQLIHYELFHFIRIVLLSVNSLKAPWYKKADYGKYLLTLNFCRTHRLRTNEWHKEICCWPFWRLWRRSSSLRVAICKLCFRGYSALMGTFLAKGYSSVKFSTGISCYATWMNLLH